MAIPIKSIPVLKDKAASSFAEKVAISTANKSSVNFIQQTAVLAQILAKTKI